MTIDHFYEEHGKSATLMCPLCLQIFVAANRQDGALSGNVNAFLEHLKEHKQSKQQKTCNRCKLVFLTMGSLRVHLFMDHGSGFEQKGQLQPISKSNTNIARPKPKVPPTAMETFIRIVEPVNKLTLDVPNGRMCLECGQDFDSSNHIIGRVQCPVCQLQTYCLPSILEHTHKCSLLPPKVKLDGEFHCVCEFSSGDAIALIRHMIACERKSAYPSVELAKENTKEDGVMDSLGLVRTGEDEEGGEGAGDEGNADVETQGEVSVEGGEAAAAEEMQVTVNTDGVPVETSAREGQIAAEMDTTESYINPEDYNPTMSLVDLAPTPSVIVQHMPEPVRDDYQVSGVEGLRDAKGIEN